MKKILFPILSLILAACSSSQVTVTRSAQVTVTSPPTATPIPTPTLHPQFVDLQTQISASGETFTLLPDGTIEQSTSDGATTVPGLFVDKNGVITLQGDSSQVTISPEDVSFDDEKGVNVKGYTLDEATGEWKPAQETIDIGGNLSVILGEKVDGGTVIDSFVTDPSLTPEQQVEKLDKVDYTAELGIPKEDAVWMQNEKGETVLVWESDHTRIIGWWMRSRTTTTTGIVLNAEEIVNPITKESFVINIGRTWNASSVFGKDLNSMQLALKSLYDKVISPIVVDRQVRVDSTQVRFKSADGKKIVFGWFSTIETDSTPGNGLLVIEDVDYENNPPHVITVTGFDPNNFDN